MKKLLLLLCATCLLYSFSARAQSDLPQPLKFADTTIADFGFGLDLVPIILPNKNLLVNIALLGNGFYECKYLGKTADGSLLYDKPIRNEEFSNRFNAGKAICVNSSTPMYFFSEKSNSQWVNVELASGSNLAIANTTPLTVAGSPLTGEFTILNNQEGIFLVKYSALNEGKSYWPGGISPWGYPPNPEIGFNKGYDANGNWKGDKTRTQFSYAILNNISTWEFGIYKKVQYNGAALTLEYYQSPSKIASVNLFGSTDWQAMITWDVDRLGLFDVGLVNGNLTFFDKALPAGIAAITQEIYSGAYTSPTSPIYAGLGSTNGFVMGGNPGILIEYYFDDQNQLWKQRPVKIKGGDLHIQTLAAPQWVDWDGDGIADIIGGDSSGFIWFFKNLGTDEQPIWKPAVKLKSGTNTIHHQAGLTGSIQGPNEKRWGYVQPLVVDWDNDGLLDIVCNDVTGNYVVYKNVGTNQQPQLDLAIPLVFNGQSFKAAWRSKPAVVPRYFFQNTTQAEPMLAISGNGILNRYTRNTDPNQLVSEIPLKWANGDSIRIVGFAGNEGRATLSVCDYNKDGKWDILFGQGVHMYSSKEVIEAKSYATAYILLNVGTNNEPLFSRPKTLYQENGNAINMDRHGCWVSPILSPEGYLVHLLAGGEDGRFYLFRNPQVFDTPVPEETVPGTMQGNTGNIKVTYGGNQVTYTTVRAKDGNVWLQQNLGSSNVATTRTDATAWGDLFQWGRWDDGHQRRVGATTSAVSPAPNNPSGLNKTGTNPFYYNTTAANRWWSAGTATDKAEAEIPGDILAANGCDPCKKLLGLQWRLPTIAEWEAVRIAEGITEYTTAFTSNLKIPSITFRDGTTGNLNTNTNTTRLWSSTAGSSGGAYVFHLVSNAASTTNNISRANGYPIRCIREALVTLPLGLINFKGKRQGNATELEWSVSSELNNARFIVEHAVDGKTFKAISTVASKGSIAGSHTYRYQYQYPMVGNNYYKLKEVNVNGIENELSTIVVPHTLLGMEEMTVSATDQSVKILLAGFSQKAKKVIILSILGQVVYQDRVADNDITLPLALKKGLYIAQVEFETNTVKAVKFLR